MAITRTAPYGTMVDDSGGGVDGTVFNNAWLQGMLNLIDARWSSISNTTTGTQNNVSITTGGVEADVFAWGGSADTTITGFAAPSSPAKPWKPLIILNGSNTANVFLAHLSGSSSAANQMNNLATSAPTPLGLRGAAIYVYSSGTNTWRQVFHEQGGWITPSFSAGNYTATSAGTWTVASGNVITRAYRLQGKTLTTSWYLNGTTITGSTASTTGLVMSSGSYGGFTTAKTMLNVTTGINGGGVNVACYAQTSAGATSIQINQLTVGQWINSAGLTNVYGQLTFEVT